MNSDFLLLIMSSINKGKNINLVGYGNSGKTCYARCLGGKGEKYHHWLNGLVYTIQHEGNVYNAWDTDGDQHVYMDGFIVMFDLTSKHSYESIESWIENARESNPEAPIVVCGNKCESENIEVNKEQIDSLKKKYIYVEMSVNDHKNIFKPFEYFA